MTYEKFIELVKKMREAQRTFFATRSATWLADSKKLEHQVDHAIANNEVGQAELFE